MPPILKNPWLLVPLLIIGSTVALAFQQARVPSRADWSAAAASIRSELQAGDGVSFAPPHAGEARLVLHDLPAFHLGPAPQADLSRYDRVWLMGAFGQSAEDLPKGHKILKRARFGGVQLDLVEVGGPRVMADLYAELEAVRVSRVPQKGGAAQACDFWDGRSWHCELNRSPDETRACLARPVAQRLSDRRKDPHCGLNPWVHVGRDVRVIGAQPRRCIWLHPMDRAQVTLEWPAEVRPGDEIVLDYGFTDQVTVDHDRPESRTQPAQLALHQGAPLAQIEVAPVFGWHRHTVAARSGEPVRITAHTTQMVDAHLCIDLTVRRPR